jgi:hypothetical protein
MTNTTPDIPFAAYVQCRGHRLLGVKQTQPRSRRFELQFEVSADDWERLTLEFYSQYPESAVPAKAYNESVDAMRSIVRERLKAL